MLTQAEANMLISSLKQLLTDINIINFPEPGDKLLLSCKDGNNNTYMIDVTRGSIKPTKSTFQTRHRKTTVLVRVDIDGPPLDNPDGEEVPCPHIHIYREGFEDRWAFPLDVKIKTNTKDLIQVLIDFFTYNNISNRHELSFKEGIYLMASKDNLKELYIDWLNSKISYKDIESGTIEITTPFLDRHNDRLQIYAVPIENGEIKLTDDGFILSDLQLSGFELGSSKKRKQLFNTIINGYGVSFNPELNELQIITDLKNFPRKKHMLMQAMMTVNDMFMTSKSTVSSLFVEDVGNFLEANDIRYNENILLAGKSGYNHNFNYLIPHYKKAPERVIHTMNIPSKGNLSNVIFSWSDTRDLRNKLSYKSDLHIFINDQERSVDDNILNAFKIESINPILWSNRQAMIDILSA
ncbi:DUF6978 family protein [Bacillus sp. DJP31]|uniref:DUF6978 family protein n=1 Tax=Bacillus sp. DJP31 TaxID=3409789 RepID=UPI003BB7586F